MMKHGTTLSVQGIVTSVMSSKCLVSVKASDALKASKKLTSWWTMSGWSVTKSNAASCSLFRGVSESGDITLEASMTSNVLSVTAGSRAQDFTITSYKDGGWTYLAVCLDGETCSVWMRKAYKYGNTMRSSSLGSWSAAMRFDSLEVSHFEAGQAQTFLQMCNIRLYEVPQAVEERQVILDSQSRYPANENMTIITDSPNVDNKMSYIGRVS